MKSAIMAVSINNGSNSKGGADMEAEGMTKEELTKITVEEFARLQRYMILAEKDSEIYKAMKGRYIELKVILTTSGVNITELDVIKE